MKDDRCVLPDVHCGIVSHCHGRCHWDGPGHQLGDGEVRSGTRRSVAGGGPESHDRAYPGREGAPSGLKPAVHIM